MSHQQRQQRPSKPKLKPTDVAVEISWVSNLTIGRRVYVKWKYSPLEHGRTPASTVSVSEKAEFNLNYEDEGESENEGESTKKGGVHLKKESPVFEIRNKKKLKELIFELREENEKGRSRGIGCAALCLPSLASKAASVERQVLLEFDADPKKSSTLLVNKRPILCLHVKCHEHKRGGSGAD